MACSFIGSALVAQIASKSSSLIWRGGFRSAARTTLRRMAPPLALRKLITAEGRCGAGLVGSYPIRRGRSLRAHPQLDHVHRLARIADYEGDALGPGFEGTALFVGVLVPVIGAGERALGVVQHAVDGVLRHMQRGHARARGSPEIVQRPAGDTRFAIEDSLQPL